MSYTEKELKEELDNKSYEFGFVTDIESEKAPIGLNEDIIKLISSKKNEPQWMLAYRLEAFRVWQKMSRCFSRFTTNRYKNFFWQKY